MGAGLAQLMQDLLDDHPEWEATGFDVIAHSMGCLVTAEAHRLGAPIDRKVLIAGPHYGAFLAFAVLNPRVSVIDGFKAFILELAWDARFKTSGASENFQDGLKRIARGFPSVFELLPDDFYFDDLNLRVVEYLGPKREPAPGAGQHRPRHLHRPARRLPQGVRQPRPQRPTVQAAAADAAPRRSRQDAGDLLRTRSRPRRRTPSPRGTPDIVMFQRARRPREFGPIRDSGQNGDGTVPTGSARDLRGAINVRKIDGNHNQIANDDATIALIRRHLGVD